MPVFMKFDGVDGEFNGGDNFDFPQLTTEPTAPEDGTTKIYAKPLTFTATVTTPYDDPLVLVTEADPEGAIAGVVIAATSDNNRSDDTFDFAQLTTERTVAVQDDGLVLVTDADPEGAIAGIIIAATSDNNRSDGDDGLLLPAVKDYGLLLPASGASGDVNGDTDALGDPITFTYTVTNTSSAYEGSHALYQDVIIPTLDAETIFRHSDAVWW